MLPPMQLRHIYRLQSFLQVLDAGSFAKAAEIVGIVQPALSRQIKALEDEMGIQLLTRHPWGVVPTQAGRILAASCTRIINNIEGLRQEVLAREQAVSGIVSLAASSTLAAPIFELLFSAVRIRAPNVSLRFADQLTTEITLDMLAGKLDLAIMQSSRPLAGIRFEPLFRERFGIIGAPDRITEIQRLAIENYADLPVVLPPPPNDTRTRIELAVGTGKLNIVCEGGGVQSMIRIAASGAAYGFINFAAVEADVRRGELAFLPLASPLLEREISVASPINTPATKAAELVRSELVQLIQTHGERMRWQVFAPPATNI